ncbi:MAG: TolC family protein, partial [Armatimonadota bacterium]|nr:TolC family protein [Armatimonadota bacterium]
APSPHPSREGRGISRRVRNGFLAVALFVSLVPPVHAQNPAMDAPPVTAVPTAPTASESRPALADARQQAAETAPVLSFTEAIVRVLQNNPQRAAARAGLQAAQARIGTARSAGGLQVGINGNATTNQSFGVPSSNTGTGGNTNLAQSFNPDFSESLTTSAQLPLYTGGRVKASTRAAEAAARTQAAQTVQVEQDLVLTAATTYLGILRSEQLLEVAESNLAVSREQRRVAQVRFEAGAAARLDVFRAETTLADAEQRRVTASSTVAQAKAQLNTLMGRAPETPLRIEGIDSVAPPVPLTAAVEPPRYPALAERGAAELRTVAEASNPSLAAAREQVRAAEANVDVAKAQRKPSLGLNLTSILRNPVTFLGRFSAALALGVAQTLFDSGRTRSQVNEARNLVEQARQGLAGERLTVANRIEQLLLTGDTAEHRLRSTDTAVLAAREAVRAAQLGYTAGVRTAVEVSDAQAALLAAQTEAVNARFDLALARAQLASAAGVLTPEWRAAYEAALRAELQKLKR